MKREIKSVTVDRNLRWSILDSAVEFSHGFKDLRSLYSFYREHASVVKLLWVTKQPVMEESRVYNPKTLIVGFLN